MPKGVTNQKLVIWVAPQWYAQEAILALMRQGHSVYSMDSVISCGSADTPDLILHPAAHGWSDEMFAEETKKDGTAYRPYLDMAITAARARKRGKHAYSLT